MSNKENNKKILPHLFSSYNEAWWNILLYFIEKEEDYINEEADVDDYFYIDKIGNIEFLHSRFWCIKGEYLAHTERKVFDEETGLWELPYDCTKMKFCNYQFSRQYNIPLSLNRDGYTAALVYDAEKEDGPDDLATLLILDDRQKVDNVDIEAGIKYCEEMDDGFPH
jgi:hypothetical protein